MVIKRKLLKELASINWGEGGGIIHVGNAIFSHKLLSTNYLLMM